MAMTMHANIVSAEAEIFSGTVEIVVAPAIMGEVGIYPRHTQMLTTLKPGEVRVTKQGGEEESFYVSGGILEVQPHAVTILSDTCVRARDLDEAAALEAKQAAEDALKDKAGQMELAEAQAKLAEAVAQLQAIERMRKKLNR
ncbi:MAG: F0F1 ATP synthase subunit epsilon [Proteobacteria bacterium]|jgi:F-type H+-transporting ATPase subunit epsilon|nr:F0F1 ATP synthase subunit epsilon [Pseudomonadota bacterium]MCG6934505.1 F0F1 ATP synthase subunit epsilon [Pseudomonadota bacterium]